MDELKKRKAEEKLQKQEEKQNAKILRIAQLEVNNTKKPGECLKQLTVEIDENFFNTEYGPPLVQSLRETNLKCKTIQSIRNSITWKREEQFLEMENRKPKIRINIIDETELIIFMDSNQVSNLVATSTLQQYILEQKTLAGNKMITIALFGLQKYFKNLKSQKGKKKNTDGSKITAKELEHQLTELQIIAQINHRTVETQDDLNAMVFQYSKSLAEAPAKKERRAKEENLNCFVKGSNKDCVRVDKDGNGLGRVWQQQLMEFPLMGLETAEAILQEYPNPNILFEKLEDLSEAEGELLFQNLLIRRAAGPIALQRKVGPEASKRLYKFFSSMDGNIVISEE